MALQNLSKLVKLMACWLFDAKSSSAPVPLIGQLEPWKQIPEKLQMNENILTDIKEHASQYVFCKMAPIIATICLLCFGN